MDDDCELILHVGLPKGGSSALQTALSMTPDLTSASGRQLRYTALRQRGGLISIRYGEDLSCDARRSPYGYVSWPNMKAGDAASPVFEALGKVMAAGREGGFVPIASCEGWVSRPNIFARQLQMWGHPRVEVVAFLRPPLDWVNAAYWQWGIWHQPDLDLWLKRGNLPYEFGPVLERWSTIPNLRLRLGNARPDVVAKFSEFYGVDLPNALSSNTSSPPALIGFLLRNRQFRSSGHDASTEFIFQRWCPPVEGRKPWAIRARHVWQLRPMVQRNRAALQRIASEAELADIFSDARWTDESRYHGALREGVSALDDRTEMAGLRESLLEGLHRACAAVGRPMPAVPDCPGEGASTREWDDMFCPLMEALLRADLAVREVQGGRELRGLKARMMRSFPKLFGG